MNLTVARINAARVGLQIGLGQIPIMRGLLYIALRLGCVEGVR